MNANKLEVSKLIIIALLAAITKGCNTFNANQFTAVPSNASPTATISSTLTSMPTINIPDSTSTPTPTVFLVNSDDEREFSETGSLKVKFINVNSTPEHPVYKWFRNDILIASTQDPILSNEAMRTFDGSNKAELTPASVHTDHTIRGYSFRVDVLNQDGTIYGTDRIIIGGPVFPEEKMRGISVINEVYDPSQIQLATESLETLTDRLNLNWISLWNMYFVQEINSTTIFEDHSGLEDTTSSLESIGAIIDFAHNKGVHVLYIPQLRTVTGPARSGMVPSEEWFTSYHQFILEQAKFAEEHDVDIFSLGAELDSMGQFDSKWRQIIIDVRKIYTGKLTYFANTNDTPVGRVGWEWDITWWDALDYIGANFYVYENVHSKDTDPTQSELQTLYKPFISKLKLLSEKYNKPVILTELESFSADGILHLKPHKDIYPYLCNGTLRVDMQEQADFTATIMNLVSANSSVEGTFWGLLGLRNEGWIPQAGGSCWSASQYILDKPVEFVIRSWYGWP